MGQAKGKPQPIAKGTSKGKPPLSSTKESSKKRNQYSSQGSKNECPFCGCSGHLDERCYAKQAASKVAKEQGKSQSIASHTNPRGFKDSKAKVAYVVKTS